MKSLMTLTSSNKCVIRTDLTDDLKTYQTLNASSIKTERIYGQLVQE